MILNAFDASTVTAYYEVSENSCAAPTVEPNFLNDVNYQTPRSFRFTARYTF